MIAFTADHHFWSYPLFAQEGPEGINSRLAEQLAVEDFLSEQLALRGVTTHVRLGDLFERRNMLDAVVFREVQKRILRNTTVYGMQEIILGGNHDLAAGGQRWTIEGLATIPGCRVVTQQTLVETPEVALVCAPYHPENGTLPQEPLTRDAALLCAHVDLNGAKVSSEFRLKTACTYEQLHPEWYVGVLAGHIHYPQHPYVGSLTQRSFSDAGPGRRAILWDPTTTMCEDLPLPGPRFETVDVTTLDDRSFDAETYYHLRIAGDISLEEATAWATPCRGKLVSRADVECSVRAAALRDERLSFETLLPQWAAERPELDQARLLHLGRSLLQETA